MNEMSYSSKFFILNSRASRAKFFSLYDFLGSDMGLEKCIDFGSLDGKYALKPSSIFYLYKRLAKRINRRMQNRIIKFNKRKVLNFQICLELGKIFRSLQ